MDVQRDLGRIDAEVAALKEAVDRLSDTVYAMNQTLTEAKGGWKTLMAVAGVAGTLGAAGTKILAFLYSK